MLISVLPASSIQAVVASASLNVLRDHRPASVLYVVLALIWSRYFRRMVDEISTRIRASRTQPEGLSHGGMRELRHVYAELAEVSKDYHEARQQANLDKLTGLYNRRFFDERLNRLLLDQHPFCLAMIDLDGFKRVNDTYGHQTGVVVLKRVSSLGARLGDHGWVCRYGGEELVVLFANPDVHFCLMLLEQFRRWVTGLGANPALGSPSAAAWWRAPRDGCQAPAGHGRCRGLPGQAGWQEPIHLGRPRRRTACRQTTAC